MTQHRLLGAVILALLFTSSSASAQGKKPEFPPYDEVVKDYEKVATPPGENGLLTIHVDNTNGQMLAELPRNFAKNWYFFAMTVSSGEAFAGLQSNDEVVYWRRYGKRLALIRPNLRVRSTGDSDSRASVDRIFTDTVLLDIPILTERPGGGPVIDMDDLLLGNASTFFGRSASGINRRLATIAKAKAFPHNVELRFEAPTSGGALKSFHYSVSVIRDNPRYKPRPADQRVGYFTTSFTDLGKYAHDDKRVEYINRWHLEKADPKLKLSPPVEPIKFYIEHTTPIRYRRFVADGVLAWNKAFRKIGIDNAVVVEFQDAKTGRHMDKDPEDVRYNFVRWLNNDISTAIGPSRVHPKTGEILDADIVLTDGWIRTFEFQFSRQLPQIAMEGLGPDALTWFNDNPQWDPRILLADPHDRQVILAERALRGVLPFGGHPLGNLDGELMGDDEYDGLVDVHSQTNGLCNCAVGKGFDLTILRMTLGMMGDDDDDNDEPGDKEDDDDGDGDSDDDEDPADIGDNDMLDGLPAKFIGPLLADLVSHEVGHTLGLRHNFKASALYTLKQINSDEVRGKKPFTASVMDYNPININMDEDGVQGDYAMIDIGPYDYWAIEYGYTFAKDLNPILARSTEPEHAYLTDEDTMGPDPLARRYDFTADPLDYAENQMKLASYHRENLLEKFVRKGDTWGKARQGYEMSLGMQSGSLSIMNNWLGGSFINRDKKGDNGDRDPIVPVPAATQRKALNFCIENCFHDESFHLSPQLLRRLALSREKTGNGFAAMFASAEWPVHDRITGLQTSLLATMMNPVTLRRIYDNEWYTDTAEDCMTLTEYLDTIYDDIWSELDKKQAMDYNVRQPLVSSLRRNLQSTHLDLLVSLSVGGGKSAATRTISTLATMQISDMRNRIDVALNESAMDSYTKAHLADVLKRIDRALDAKYVVNK